MWPQNPPAGLPREKPALQGKEQAQLGHAETRGDGDSESWLDVTFPAR